MESTEQISNEEIIKALRDENDRLNKELSFAERANDELGKTIVRMAVDETYRRSEINQRR